MSYLQIYLLAGLAVMIVLGLMTLPNLKEDAIEVHSKMPLLSVNATKVALMLAFILTGFFLIPLWPIQLYIVTRKSLRGEL